MREVLLLALLFLAAAAPAPSLELAALTWPELRAAIQDGVDTVLVPIGGTEQNGPQMALGKHNAIVAATARIAAERLGRTLIAPVIPLAPEGEFNRRWPGTLGISEKAMADVLDGVVQSLKQSGFRIVVLLGDHGGSQAAQAEVAKRWDKKDGVRVLDGAAYYADNGQTEFLATRGIERKAAEAHAGVTDTAELMAAAPEMVRREAPKLPEPNGSESDPSAATPELGRQLIELKAARIVRLVAEARAGK